MMDNIIDDHYFMDEVHIYIDEIYKIKAKEIFNLLEERLKQLK